MKNDVFYALVTSIDGEQRKIALEWHEKADAITATFPALADWHNIKTIDFAPDLGKAEVGEDGYYVVPHGEHSIGDSFLCRFHKRVDTQLVSSGFVMPMFGVIRSESSYATIVSGMSYDYQLIVKLKSDHYSIYPRFALDGTPPYEPIRVEYHWLRGDSPDYNDIARVYQRWQIEHNNLTAIRDRVRSQVALSYAERSVYVRIRLGWKPVPPPVDEQTPENEPPMYVASTFADVAALIEEFNRKGIKRAEFCLVGWNISGHDGRWPQIFPVEPAFGGEMELRSLIQKAKSYGYMIVCHTNFTDAYTIADCWSEDDIIRMPNGKLSQNATSWSGGNMYQLCPQASLRLARESLPKVKELGFSGLQYTDVITTVTPRTCYSEIHPMTTRQTVEALREIMRLQRHLFGGFSSEGGYDFAMPELDFALYISFGLKPSSLVDDVIPLWQLVYHGYVLSNPYATSVNPTAFELLRVIEYGGRPTFYYDSQFVTESAERKNWMGQEDFHCSTHAERQASVDFISRVDRIYQKLAYLQEAFMQKHEHLAGNQARVTYSDGSVVMVDYNTGEAFLNGQRLWHNTGKSDLVLSKSNSAQESSKSKT